MNLVLPERFSDESGYGYIQRVLHSNGLRWGWMCTQLGLSTGVLPTGSDALKVIELVKGTVSNHDFLTREADENKVSRLRLYQNSFIGHWQILGKTQKVCPTCLIQAGYTKKLWDLDMTSVCHIHKAPLTRYCLNCACAISWFRKSYVFCRCGMPFGSENSQTTVSENEVLWANWLNHKLNNTLSSVEFFPFLKDLSLGVVLQLIKVLGLSSLPQNIWSRSLHAHTSDTYAPAVIESAVQTLRNVDARDTDKKTSMTHYQELGYERLLAWASSLSEMRTLHSLYEAITGRSPSTLSRTQIQLTLSF